MSSTARPPVGRHRLAAFEAIDTLMRVTEVVERRRRQLARGVGLSDQQWRVLEGIHREHFLPSLYARERETSPAAVSRTLRHLQERGLVRARASRGDGRQREYTLTASGQRTIEALRAAREAALAAVWDDVPRAELERFTRFGEALAVRLEAYAEGVDVD